MSIISNALHLKPVVKWFATNGGKRFATLQRHMPAALGTWMAGFYVINNLKSNNIPQERKTPLLINDLICTGISVAGGYAISNQIYRFSDELLKRFDKVLANNPQKAALKSGLKAMVPLVAFSFAFRFLGPIIATPLADKVNKFLIKKGYIKDPELTKQQNIMQNQVNSIENNIFASKQTGKKLDLTFVSDTQMTPGFKQFLTNYNQ